MFDEYFKPLSVVSTTISTATLLPPDIAESSSSTSMDQDVPSPSTSPNNETTVSPILSTNVEEPNEEEDAEFNSDTRIDAIRIFIAYDAHKDMMMFQMDVKTAFLNGLQISQNPRGIFTNQSIYALEMLKKYGLDQCDVVDIPMVKRSKIDEDPIGTLVDPTRYRSKAYRITPYCGKTDVDHVGCQDSRKITSRSAQYPGEKLVTCSTKKQKCIAISTTEAEYVSLSGCCAQILWMRMEIPDTMINDAIKQSVGYMYYKHKKEECEKVKAFKEPEEQYVSPVKSERGKVSTEEQRLQQQNIKTQLTIKRQVKKDVEDIPVVTTSSMKDFSNLLNDPPIHKLVDILSKPNYTNTHKTSVVANSEGNPKKLEALTSINVSKAIEKVVQAKVLIKMKKKLPTYVPNAIAKYIKHRLNNSVCEVMKNNQISLCTTPSPTTTDDLSEMDLKLMLLNRMHQNRTHDDQDPLNNFKGETRKKISKDAGQPSSSSSKKYKALVKSGSSEAAKRRTTRFDLLLKSYIDQNEDHILGPYTIAVAKKLKELIQKDELTIADLEGDELEELKKKYKNDVELEYHVDQLYAEMLTEA
nr:hypothetical protein [Tanacetum cinerariifolium]